MIAPEASAGKRCATWDEFPTATRAWSAHIAIAGVLVCLVALPIVSFWQPRPVAPHALTISDLFVGQVMLCGALGLWFLLQNARRLRAFLALPTGNWGRRCLQGIRVGVVAWLLTLVAMGLLTAVAHRIDVTPRAGFEDIVVWIATRPFSLRVAIILVAMTVEEAFFRSFLQPRVGLVPATVLFALSHLGYGSPVMGGGVLVVGFVLARTFRRSRDLAVCAMAHGTFDAIQLLGILPFIASRLGDGVGLTVG